MELYGTVPNSVLTNCRKDLELIEALWRQDVDLGVGKEVYDAALRQELERERDLEILKQKEKQKAQLAVREREDRAKQEQAGKWLKQNFMRDGETGEWVKRHNSTNGKNNASTLFPTTEESFNNESLTLDAALDYLSSSFEPGLLPLDTQLEKPADTFVHGYTQLQVSPLTNEVRALQHEVQILQPPQTQIDNTQDSLEESWNELVDYLMFNNSDNNVPVVNVLNDIVGVEIQDVKPVVNTSTELDFGVDLGQNNYLLQNATLPSLGSDIGNEFVSEPITNVSCVNQESPINSSMDWNLGDLDFLGDIDILQGQPIVDLDLQSVEDLLNIPAPVDMINTTSLDCQPAGFDAIAAFTEELEPTTMYDVTNANVPPVDVFSDDLGGLEGAIGGTEFDPSDRGKISRLSDSSSDSGFVYQGGFSSPSSSSSSSYAASPASSHNGNGSTSSNDTDHDPHNTRTLAHQVAHNHTYNTLPGHLPREVKKYAQKDPCRKGPHSRDQKRAEEMKIPFTIDEIIESPVETFSEMLSKYKLSEGQLSMIRDIRRRGKNKVAAQNCRKRKVGVIVTLADEMLELEKARDRLKAERAEMERETRSQREKFGHLYSHIFQSLRDEHGQPYDPNFYSLQQSSDGNIFLVPRNVSSNGNSTNGDMEENNGLKKRKSLGN